jgi:MFS family permease
VRRLFLFIIVFVSGGVVLAFEIMAGRLLQPTFGSQVEVWGNLLAVFMAGLAAGYYGGGHLADHGASYFRLGILVLISAVLLATLPLYAVRVCERIFIAMPDEKVVTLGSLAASMALFFLPTTVLGTVSPYSVRLLATDPKRLGRLVGSLYALSTLGSIAGALGTTFLLIAYYDQTQVFLILGALQAILFVIAVACAWMRD